MSTKRLYIYTGKGGVGKTTLSLSFAKYLADQGQKVQVAYFKNSKLDENSKTYQEVNSKAEAIGVPYLALDLQESSKAYITKKLGSATIASWVVRTPFFKSLINMIPGFNYLIYMGQMLELLRDDPKLTIVLDSPSSGHALTMFEATKNFNQIFQKGALYQDTQEMLRLLKQEDFVQVNIVTLPTTLALQEAKELQQSLRNIEDFHTEIICNYSLENFAELDLTANLRTKLDNELVARNQSQAKVDHLIPFCLAAQTQDLNKELLPSMENLV